MEAMFWQHARHPNILPLLGVAKLESGDPFSPTRFAFVSPWLSGAPS